MEDGDKGIEFRLTECKDDELIVVVDDCNSKETTNGHAFKCFQPHLPLACQCLCLDGSEEPSTSLVA